LKHVLMVVPRALWPEYSGGEIRVASLLRRLAGRYRFTVLTFGSPGEKAMFEASAAMMAHKTGARTVLAWRTPGAAAPADLPALAAGYFDPSLARALAELAADDPPNLIHLEFTQMAQYAEAAARLAPVVLTEHDSSLLSPSHTYVRGGADAGERARGEAYFRRAFSACARVVVVSQADADRLAPYAAAGKLAVVPTGVDLERFAFAPLEGRRKNEALFVGHYPHYPNEDAAVHLCRDVMPGLIRRVPARLRLVGSWPTEAVRALAGPDVEVVGEVEDVAPELRRARVFLAPMRLGFGIKGKILEAFACGIPVVATPQACEAMPGLEEGKHLLLGRDPEAFAAAAARALGDEALSRDLALQARAYVEARFDWAAQADLLDSVYRSAMKTGRLCPI
jgi:glycosyltransferase involved in cell wall biosynthesis